MTSSRRTLTRTDRPLAHAALGPTRTLTAVERLRGGSKTTARASTSSRRPTTA